MEISIISSVLNYLKTHGVKTPQQKFHRERVWDFPINFRGEIALILDFGHDYEIDLVWEWSLIGKKNSDFLQDS